MAMMDAAWSWTRWMQQQKHRSQLIMRARDHYDIISRCRRGASLVPIATRARQRSLKHAHVHFSFEFNHSIELSISARG